MIAHLIGVSYHQMQSFDFRCDPVGKPYLLSFAYHGSVSASLAGVLIGVVGDSPYCVPLQSAGSDSSIEGNSQSLVCIDTVGKSYRRR